eukprot:11211308-Lingulodinium_polyedra.AAC.1
MGSSGRSAPVRLWMALVTGPPLWPSAPSSASRSQSDVPGRATAPGTAPSRAGPWSHWPSSHSTLAAAPP